MYSCHLCGADTQQWVIHENLSAPLCYDCFDSVKQTYTTRGLQMLAARPAEPEKPGETGRQASFNPLHSALKSLAERVRRLEQKHDAFVSTMKHFNKVFSTPCVCTPSITCERCLEVNVLVKSLCEDGV